MFTATPAFTSIIPTPEVMVIVAEMENLGDLAITPSLSDLQEKLVSSARILIVFANILATLLNVYHTRNTVLNMDTHNGIFL